MKYLPLIAVFVLTILVVVLLANALAKGEALPIASDILLLINLLLLSSYAFRKAAGK